MSVTPLGVILSLSQDCEGNSKQRKQSYSGFTPWSDRHAFPTIRHKLSNPQNLNDKLIRKRLNQSISDKNSSEYFVRKKSVRHYIDPRTTIRYTTIDMSKLPNFSPQKLTQKTSSGKFLKTYNTTHKPFKQFSIDFHTIEQQRYLTRRENNQKRQELKRKLKRRKQNKPIYQGLVTKQYLYSRHTSSQTKRTPIINFPMQITKGTPKIASSKIMTAYGSLLSRQRHLNRTADGEIREQKDDDKDDGKQWKGLSQLLELSSNLFTKAFKEHKYS